MHSNNSRVHFMLAALYVFMIVGSNETVMLLLLYFQLLNLFFGFINTRKLNRQQLVLFFIACMCAAVVVLSPGNGARSTLFENGHNVTHTVKHVLLFTVNYLSVWFPSFIASAIIVFYILKKLPQAETPSAFKVHPAYALLLFLSIPVASVTPVIWTTGNENVYPRVINTAYFFTLVSFLYFICTLFFYLAKNGEKHILISPAIYLLAVTLIIHQLYFPDHHYHPNNVRKAYMDLATGRAQGHERQLKHRFETIASSSADTVYVPALANQSQILLPTEYAIDVTNSMNDWRNKSLAEFYNKKAVLLAPVH